MKRPFFRRILGLFLAVCFIAPDPVLGLRPTIQGKTQAGLEETLKKWAGLEEPLLLQPGHERYKEIFSGKDPLDAVLALQEYLNADPKKPVLLRVVPRTHQEAQEWIELGLKPLLAPESWRASLAKNTRWPPQVWPAEGDPFRIDFTPSDSPGLPITTLSILSPRNAPLKQGNGFSYNFSQSVKDLQGGRPVDSSTFLGQISTYLDLGVLALVGIPLGLPHPQDKERFLRGTGLPDRFLSEEEFTQEQMDRRAQELAVQTRIQSEEQERRQREMESLLSPFAPEIERARGSLQAELSKRAPYLDPNGAEEAGQEISRLNLSAVAEKMAREGAASGSPVQLKEFLAAEERRLREMVDALGARPVPSRQIDSVLKELLVHFPELLPSHSSLLGKEWEDHARGEVRGFLGEVFSDRDVLKNGWTPWRLVRFLEVFRQVRDLIGQKVPDFPWFSGVKINGGLKGSKAVISAALASYPKDPDRTATYLILNMNHPNYPAVRLLEEERWLLFRAVAYSMLYSDFLSRPGPLNGPRGMAQPGGLYVVADPVVRDEDVQRVIRGFPDHPWLQGIALSEKDSRDPNLLKMWKGGALVAVGRGFTVVDLVSARVALLLSGNDPQVVDQVKREVVAGLLRLQGDLKKRKSIEDLKAAYWNLLERHSRLFQQRQQLPDSEEGKSMQWARQMAERMSDNVAALSALAAFGVLLRDVGGLEFLPLIDRIAPGILLDMRRLGGRFFQRLGFPLVDDVVPETDWGSIYRQTQEVYRRISEGVRLRSAAGLEVAVVRERAAALWQGAEERVSAERGLQVLIFRDPKTFYLVPLALRRGRTVAVDLDGPAADSLRTLLDELKERNLISGTYAIGSRGSAFLIEGAALFVVTPDNRRDLLELLGFRPDDLPPAIPDALEATRTFLDLAA